MVIGFQQGRQTPNTSGARKTSKIGSEPVFFPVAVTRRFKPATSPDFFTRRRIAPGPRLAALLGLGQGARGCGRIGFSP